MMSSYRPAPNHAVALAGADAGRVVHGDFGAVALHGMALHGETAAFHGRTVQAIERAGAVGTEEAAAARRLQRLAVADQAAVDGVLAAQLVDIEGEHLGATTDEVDAGLGQEDRFALGQGVHARAVAVRLARAQAAHIAEAAAP